MRELNAIVVHSSNTPMSTRLTLAALDRKERKSGKLGIGVHFYIDRNGTVHEGRHIEKVGVHAGRRNEGSVGIMLEGGVNEKHVALNNFTLEQMASLAALIMHLCDEHPTINRVNGFTPYSPPFDVVEWYSSTIGEM